MNEWGDKDTSVACYPEIIILYFRPFCDVVSSMVYDLRLFRILQEMPVAIHLEMPAVVYD